MTIVSMLAATALQVAGAQAATPYPTDMQRAEICYAHVTILIEDGLTYDKLRGVSFDGTAEIVTDPEVLWKVGVSVWERYNGPYTDDVKPLVEFMLHKRVAVRVDVARARSWDHRKLGLDDIALGGSTAAHLDDQLR